MPSAQQSWTPFALPLVGVLPLPLGVAMRLQELPLPLVAGAGAFFGWSAPKRDSMAPTMHSLMT